MENKELALSSEAILAKVLDSGSIEVFEKFIELRNAEEARQAKRRFDEEFAKMQAEYVPVARTREVWNKPHDRILYRFAPLEDILKVYSPIISRHGFSYRWQEETLEGNTKRVWCIVSGYGHEEKTYVDIPIMPGNDFTNSVQQRGVSTSYGKRYSFANTFGIIFAGDDDEGQFEPDTIIGVADEVSKLKAAKNMAELAQVFSAVYNKVKADTSLDEEDRKSRLELLTATKDEMKRSLQ